MNILGKLQGLLGDNEEDQIEENGTDIMSRTPERSVEEPTPKSNKVVNIHATTQLKVVVMQPENFEDAKGIADHLKTKKPVIINLENLDSDVARRVVDFLSGSVYGLDGNIQKVASGIFLIAPYNVSIMGDFKNELQSKGLFSW